jgi:adenylosuccinate lyase
VERLEEQMRLLFNIRYHRAKFATGNYNAHHVAYPQIDWRKFEEPLLKETWVTPSFPTTQIEHYDHFAAFLML